MEIHRIDGIKYDFDRLEESELENIHGHLLENHQRVIQEIELVENALFARRHESIPFDTGIQNYERALGHACLAGEIDAQEAYEALSRFET